MSSHTCCTTFARQSRDIRETLTRCSHNEIANIYHQRPSHDVLANVVRLSLEGRTIVARWFWEKMTNQEKINILATILPWDFKKDGPGLGPGRYYKGCSMLACCSCNQEVESKKTQDEAEEECVDQGMVIKETQVRNVWKAYETYQRRRQSRKLETPELSSSEAAGAWTDSVGWGSGVAATLPLPLPFFCFAGMVKLSMWANCFKTYYYIYPGPHTNHSRHSCESFKTFSR